MIVSLSERQRGAIYLRLTSRPDWGGTEDSLMARAEGWEALRLSEFDGKEVVPAKLKRAAAKYKMSAEAVDHLIAQLPAVGMTAGLALEVAAIIRQLRISRPLTKAKAP